MKAMLVVDIPSDYGDIVDNKAIVTLRNGKLGTSLGIYNVPLKPLPEKKDVPPDYGMMYGNPFGEGWNACLKEILNVR